ncbi:hypothetical protein MTO96_009580 [Rhipicephalus appendiculatus]
MESVKHRSACAQGPKVERHAVGEHSPAKRGANGEEEKGRESRISAGQYTTETRGRDKCAESPYQQQLIATNGRPHCGQRPERRTDAGEKADTNAFAASPGRAGSLQGENATRYRDSGVAQTDRRPTTAMHGMAA